MVKVEAEFLRRAFEPVLIRRDVVRRVELDAHEDLRRDRDALLRQVGRDRVNAHELRREAIGPCEPRRRLGAHARDFGGGARRRGVHDLPRQRGAIGRVLADEAVQVRRARARQADDEHGGGDPLLLDARVRRALGFHAQQVVEQAHEIFADSDPAERREVGLVVIGLQQPLERLGEVPCAVAARPRPALRGAVQRVRVERRSIDAEPAQRSTAQVQATDRGPDAGLRESHRWKRVCYYATPAFWPRSLASSNERGRDQIVDR